MAPSTLTERVAVPFAVYPTANAACAAVRAREAHFHTPVAPWHARRHAVARFGFGSNVAGGSSAFDADRWWRDQVSAGTKSVGYGGVRDLVEAYPTLSLNSAQTTSWLVAHKHNALSWEAMRQLTSATLVLQAFSPAQLYESLVDLFANHLNVSNLYDAAAATRVTFDRDTIRAHVFGRYRDMLQASARDVTMQRYLTLSQSTRKALNENYGRELLELHTVTPAAGYTQAEVVDSARIMTGRFHDGAYNYVYMSGRHWVGPVRVLGFSNANVSGAGGEKVGNDYLAYLASHPMTAQNVARKLCVRFVSDSPSAALVNAVANAYLANDTAILPAASVIFRSTEFWAMHSAKLRRPAENVVATVRALGLQPATDLALTGNALAQMCSSVGQVPLSWPSPDGYPDTAAAWRSAGSMTSAWVAQWKLVDNDWAHAFKPWQPTPLLSDPTPRTTAEALDQLAVKLLGTPLVGHQRASLLTYLREKETTPFRASTVSRGEFRPLIALLLHSPQHSQR